MNTNLKEAVIHTTATTTRSPKKSLVFVMILMDSTEDDLLEKAQISYQSYLLEALNKAHQSGFRPVIRQLGIKVIGDELQVWAVLPFEDEAADSALGEAEAKVNGLILRGTPYRITTMYYYPEYQDEKIWSLPSDYSVISTEI